MNQKICAQFKEKKINFKRFISKLLTIEEDHIELLLHCS